MLFAVTVDFQRDPKAYTGAFEIVHEMPLHKSSSEYNNIQEQQKVKHEVIAAYNGCSLSITKNQAPSENNIEVPVSAVVEVVA